MDKVYALLGFRDDFANKLPSVLSCDYTIEPRSLFARFSADIIHLYGTLELLIGKRGEIPATEGLPSWAIDYTGALPGTPDLHSFWPHGHVWDKRGYNAGAGMEGPAPVVQENHRVLCLTGMCADTIDIVEKKTVENPPY